MCANFKPLSLEQLHNLELPEISFEYPEEVYPNYATPLLFHSAQGPEWRLGNFGLIPKSAEDKKKGTKTDNARNETLLEQPSFAEASAKCHFGVSPGSGIYEWKYLDNKPQRWGIRRKDGQATFIAAIYEVARIRGGIIRSASMITMDAIDHP